ncbi:transglycosylase domain-containing protein [Candidatus Saccharibacteria bacterium]|nr:transglycosylase domain-containing protein [Candidatus Saccharibacteria bacterium]
MAKRKTRLNGNRRVVRIPRGKDGSGGTNTAVTRSVRKVRANTVPKAKGWAKLNPKHMWAVASSKKALKIYGIAALSFFLLIAGIFAWFAKDLPSPNKINSITGAQTTKLYDRTGQQLLVEIYGNKDRSIIEFNQMPQCIKDATVSLEDKNFYKQGAFSPLGIVRAFSGIIFRDPSKGGGSTITQQYVKNALLTGERSYARKIKELILAIEIEQIYKKDDILKLYLNEIPYGSTAYGIQAASKQYFGIEAKDLSLSQCALLASLPQAPSYYSPRGNNTDELIAKKNRVLDLMVQQKYVTPEQAEQAKQIDVLAQVKPYNPYANVTAPHFVQYVREQLETKYGVKQVNEGGLKVITTLDLEKQKLSEQAITDNMKGVRGFGGSNAALVSEDPSNGQVLTMVGSYDYNNQDFGSFNVATALRQPGSSIKPIVYSNLLKKSYGAGTTLYDVKTDFGGGYSPRNYTGNTYGVVSVRQALASSLNIDAVKALYLGGINEMIGTARDMGINTFNRSASDYGLSLALGSGEVRLVDMVSAFSTFPQGGQHRNQVYALKVTNSSGKVLEDNTKPDSNKPKQVLDPQIAYMINSILSDNSARCSLGAFQCNNPLTLPGRPVAAKTGTTEDFRDAWTMGYTPKVVTGVWAGNNNNSPMTQAASIVSAPIWRQYMQAVTKNDPVEQLTASRPTGIKDITIDANTGKAPTAATKKTRTDVFPSWYNIPKADNTQSATIDTISGKLATSCTPESAKRQISGALITAEVSPNDPAFNRWNPPVQALARSLGYDSGGAIPTENDNVHDCGDAKPQVSLSVSPSTGSTFTITAGVTSGRYPTTKITYYRDGAVLSAQGLSGSTTTSITDTPPAGNHSYSAVVEDSALYSTSSNTVSVTSTGDSLGFKLSCSIPSCTLAKLGGGTITNAFLFVNGGSAAGNPKSGTNSVSWPGSYTNPSWPAEARVDGQTIPKS